MLCFAPVGVVHGCLVVGRCFLLLGGCPAFCGVVGGWWWLFENSIVCQVCLMPFIFEWLLPWLIAFSVWLVVVFCQGLGFPLGPVD